MSAVRLPAVLARMAATVDHLSHGRLEVGPGSARCREEHAENGLPFPPLRTRVWIGDAPEITDRLGAFTAAGFDGCILALEPPYDGTTIAMLERFATEVAPRFAS